MKKFLFLKLILFSFVLILLPLTFSGCGEIEYRITFECNGGIAIDSILVEENTTIDEPNISRIGYEFLGWYDSLGNDATEITFPFIVTENKTFYAKWEIHETQGLGFELINNSSYAVKNIGTASDLVIVIPEYYNNLPVCSILAYAFDYNQSITDVLIPSNVETINYSAFFYCKNLKSIVFCADSQLTYIGDNAFSSCTSLSSINIPNTTTSIGNHAFYDCNFTNLLIPSNLSYLGNYAFDSCENLNFNIKDKICYLGNNINLYLIAIKPQNFENITNAMIQSSTKFIYSQCFLGCENLINITLPNNITNIGKYALCYCQNLEKIIIPTSVMNLEENAFEYCPKLKIFCEVSSKPDNWSSNWNVSNCPIYWNGQWEVINGIPTPIN